MRWIVNFSPSPSRISPLSMHRINRHFLNGVCANETLLLTPKQSKQNPHSPLRADRLKNDHFKLLKRAISFPPYDITGRKVWASERITLLQLLSHLREASWREREKGASKTHKTDHSRNCLNLAYRNNLEINLREDVTRKIWHTLHLSSWKRAIFWEIHINIKKTFEDTSRDVLPAWLTLNGIPKIVAVRGNKVKRHSTPFHLLGDWSGEAVSTLHTEDISDGQRTPFSSCMQEQA